MRALFLTVLVGFVHLSKQESAPLITTHPSNTTSKEWDTVTLNCTASGDPPPTVTWRKNNQLLTISGRFTLDSGRLTITNVTRNDESSYYCNAANSVNSTASNSAYLTVNYPPKIITSPQNATRNEGQNVTFKCSLEGKPMSQVTWWNGDKEVNTSNSAKYTVSGPTSVSNGEASLTITKVMRGDEGFYRCKAKNDLATIESELAYLTVNYPPKIITTPQNATRNEGQNLTFKCSLEGKPMSQVTWWNGDKEVNTSNSAKYTVSGPTSVSNGEASLTITKVMRGDEGFYRCKAKNDLATIQSELAYLTVNYPPKIITTPQNATRNEGQNLTFKCSLEGKPMSQVTWWNGDKEVNTSNSAKYTVSGPTSVSNGEASLTITKVMRGDEGFYRCKAKNDLATIQSELAYLTVNYPPKIITTPQNATRNEGQNLTFKCSLEGKPMSQVTWWNGDKEVNTSNSAKYTVSGPTSVSNGEASLTITKVMRGDEGFYRCKAKNDLATIESELAYLTVNYPPKIITTPQNATRNEGQNLTFKCSLEGKPMSQVTWWNGDKEVNTSNSAKYTVSGPTSVSNGEASLTITKVMRGDEGFYRCKAKNDLATIQSELAYLTVNYPPKIITTPQNATRNEGQNLTFKCSLEGKPMSQVTWWNGDKEVNTSNSAKYTVSGPTSVSNGEASLTITKVMRGDEGFYRCKAKNDLATIQSELAYLTVNYPPNIITTPQNATRNEGQNLTFKCSLEGKPMSQVTWWNGDKEVNTSNSAKYTVSGPTSVSNGEASLTITKVMRGDEGFYRCKAKNDLATIESELAYLTVNYPPKIITTPQNATRNEGQNVTFKCSLEGKPMSQVTWWNGDKEVNTSNSAKYTVSGPTSVSNGEASLTITKVMRGDEGFYRCKAKNDLATIESELAYLTVNYPPKYFKHPASKTLNESASYTLTCTLEGKPSPSIKWLKNGQIYDTTAGSPKEVLGPMPMGNVTLVTFQLMFRKINRSDEGNYSCSANNIAGKQISSKAVIIVQYPSKVLVSPSRRTVVESSIVTFTCFVEGKPKSQVTWLKGDTEIEENSKFIVSQPTLESNSSSSLKIVNVKRADSNDYYCRARNILTSMKSSKALLTVHYSPSITTHPSNTTAIEGVNVTLNCTASGNPAPTVTWWKDSQLLNISGRLTKDNGSLTITNVTRLDEGFYYCNATHNISQYAVSNSSYLTVDYVPKILRSPSPVVKIEKETVVISCDFEGKPLPTVQWYVNDTKRLTNTSRLTISQSRDDQNATSSLTITYLNRTDEGLYKCVVSNEVKTNVASSEAQLTVNYPPAILVSPSSTTTNEYNTVTLTCELEGKPMPTVTWFKDSTKLVPDGSRIKTSHPWSYGRSVATLTIQTVNRSDEGNYSCHASNGNGDKTSTSAIVTVQYVPMILRSPSPVVKIEKETVEISCDFEGKPLPTVQWFLNDTQLNTNGSRLTVSQSGDVKNTTSSLTITNLNRADEGLYKCVISNKVKANVTSSEAQMTVNYPPAILASPSSKTTNESNTVTLTCELEGKPKPTVTWLKDGTKLVADSRRTVSHPWSYGRSVSALKIQNVNRSDEGVYKCKASNGIGDNVTSSIATLTVQYPSKIFISPQNDTKNENQSVTFKCSLEGKPMSQVSWWHGDTEVITNNSAKYTVIAPSSVSNSEASLKIDHLVRDDEGFYRCKAQNKLNTVQSDLAYLTVNYVPMILRSPSPVVKIEKETVEISCDFEGKPLPTVQWFLNDTQLNTNGSRLTVSQSGDVKNTTSSLTITNLNRADEGLYKCVISNKVKANVTSSEAQMTVNYPPAILASPSSKTTNESNTVTLTCELEGKPKPTVTWLKDGTKLVADSRRTVSHPWSYGRSVSALKIQNVNRSDEGVYKCKASNGIGDNVTSSIATLTVQYPSKIFISPQNDTKNENQSVTFKCSLEGKPMSQVSWWHGDTEVITNNSAKYTVIAPSSVSNSEASLKIDHLVRDDEGFYRCKAQNKLNTVQSDLAYLTVNYVPRILRSPSPVVKIENETVEISCDFDGKPLPTVQWFLNDTQLNTNGSRLTVSQSGDVKNATSTLTIINLNRTDEGKYKCVVTNKVKANEASSEAQLTVNYPPAILVPPSNAIINESNTVTLTCELEGKPQPTVTWLKENTKLVPDGSRILTSHPWSYRRSVSTLTIQTVNRSDEGAYSCHASNDIGANVTSASANLTVQYPPKYFKHPASKTLNESASYTLTCTLEGKPPPSVKWIKNGHVFTSAISKKEVIGLNLVKVSLIFQKINRSDEGNYSCSANNSAGKQTSSKAVIVVQYLPKILSSPSPFVKKENERVEILCGFEGKPPPTVQWYVNDTLLVVDGSRLTFTPSGDVKNATSTLTIKSLNRTDEGLYKCVVSNNVKSNIASSEAQLTVNYPPKILVPPSNITTNETNTVTLKCQLEGKPPPTVTWFKNGTELVLDSRMKTSHPWSYGRSLSTLTIQTVNRSDEGAYSCHASNSIGANNSPNASLVVNYPAEHTMAKIEYPKISKDTYNITVSITKSFTLLCKSEGKPKRTQFTWKRNDEDIIDNSNERLIVPKARLEDGGTYTCYGYNDIGSKDKSSNSIYITIDSKFPVINKDELEAKVDSISFPLKNYNHTSKGKKICYSLVFVHQGDGQKPTSDDLTKAIKGSSENVYVTGLVGVGELQKFIVGNEEYYPGEKFKDNCQKRIRRNAGSTPASPTGKRYLNKALEPGKPYSFLQRAATANKDEYEEYSWTPVVHTKKKPVEVKGPDVVAIVCGIIAAIAVIGIVVVIYAVWYRRKRDQPNEEEVAMTTRKRTKSRLNSFTRMKHSHAQYVSGNVYSAKEFENHVRLLHSNSDLLFSQEYATIASPDNVTIENSSNPEQKSKNRYNNINAFDSSRVIMSTLPEDPSSHYINANYLDGMSRKREYIAAQGPLPNTCGDFWRMIWERESRLIVMVTNCEEKGRIKCQQYWPSAGSEVYGRIEVTLLSIIELSHYTVRSFQVKMANLPEERLITQYHYTAWPDHGVPSSVTSVLNFVRKASAANPHEAGPMVVHCSAGVGRTGTFIVIDAQLKRIAAQGDVDVYNYVLHLRTQRNLMVQVEEQYILIHDVLVEAIACGNTEIQARDLRQKIRQLLKQDLETGRTPIEREFQLLSRNKSPPSKFAAANIATNKNKNRYANVLPYDDTRVHLYAQLGSDGSDYINANYIDGYMQKKLFIATQAPIPDTIPDFWRMIWEQDCSTIVMLSNEQESGKVKVHRYWPGKAPTTIANLVIEMTNEKVFDDYTLREFKVTNTGESASRTVRQYHYTAWPDIGPPDSSAGLTDLIGQVQKWQQRCGSPLITVHCSAGVGRTGVFCAVCSLVERLKSEALVDVFMTVKLLREQRPAMVQTKDQYEFCYQALGEYLDSFDPYNNFD